MAHRQLDLHGEIFRRRDGRHEGMVCIWPKTGRRRPGAPIFRATRCGKGEGATARGAFAAALRALADQAQGRR